MTEDHSMSFVPIGDSRIPSYVEDSQPLYDIPMTDSASFGIVHDLVNFVATKVNC